MTNIFAQWEAICGDTLDFLLADLIVVDLAGLVFIVAASAWWAGRKKGWW